MRLKILIIDDEIDFCLIMKNYFSRKGHEVAVAYTLKEGIALLKEIRPDILFLDNNLPDGNGWDSIDHIVEIIPQIRAYLISAHRNISSFKHKGKNVELWEKPISLSRLDTIF